MCLFTDEFEAWWDSLVVEEQIAVNASVTLLEADGVNLGFPHSSKILTSRYSHMRELRIQHQGRPYRVLYAFDPNRQALLLIGGDKPVMIVGTRPLYQSLTVCMPNT